jgi:hypothetical protein
MADTFTRDDLVAYAKQNPAATTDNTTAAVKDDDTATTDSAAASDNAADNVTDDATNGDIDLTSDSSSGEDNTDSTDSSEDGTSDDNNADSSTADAESQDGDTHTEGGKPQHSRARDRIEDLIAERNALKAYGRHLEARLAEVGTKPEKKTDDATADNTSSIPALDKDDPAPTLAKFNYDPDKYSEANAAWLNRQVAKQVTAAINQKEAIATAQKVEAKFKEQETELRKVAKDYDTVISNPNLPKLSPEAAREIVFSEAGPKLTYHLAKNPDLATRISRMAPAQQLVAIGRLEAQLLAATTAATPADKKNVSVNKNPQKKTVSKAPPPPTPASTGGQSQKNQADMSMEEWVAVERAKKSAKREQQRKIRSGNAR